MNSVVRSFDTSLPSILRFTTVACSFIFTYQDFVTESSLVELPLGPRSRISSGFAVGSYGLGGFRGRHGQRCGPCRAKPAGLAAPGRLGALTLYLARYNPPFLGYLAMIMALVTCFDRLPAGTTTAPLAV